MSRDIKGASPWLEDPFQSELHDSRILSTEDSAERVRTTQDHSRVIEADTIQNVECFRPDFHFLAFSDGERPRQRGIQLPIQRPDYIEDAHITERSQRRLREGGRIQPGDTRSNVGTRGSAGTGEWVRQHLIDALRIGNHYAAQSLIQAGSDAERLPR